MWRLSPNGNSLVEKRGKQHSVMKAGETFYEEGVTVTSVSLNYVNSSWSSNQSAKVTNSKKSCLGQHFAKTAQRYGCWSDLLTSVLRKSESSLRLPRWCALTIVPTQHGRVSSDPRVKGVRKRREGGSGADVCVEWSASALWRLYKGRSCAEWTGSCTGRLMSCDCAPTHRAVNSQSASTWKGAMRGAAGFSSLHVQTPRLWCSDTFRRRI